MKCYVYYPACEMPWLKIENFDLYIDLSGEIRLLRRDIGLDKTSRLWDKSRCTCKDS